MVHCYSDLPARACMGVGEQSGLSGHVDRILYFLQLDVQKGVTVAIITGSYDLCQGGLVKKTVS